VRIARTCRPSSIVCVSGRTPWPPPSERVRCAGGKAWSVAVAAEGADLVSACPMNPCSRNSFFRRCAHCARKEVKCAVLSSRRKELEVS
jgi:hypothetical protein